jgi:peptidyl-prolyl cis-trans isomerase D
MKDELATTANVIEFAGSASDRKMDTRFYKKGELGEELDAFLFDGKDNRGVYGPYLNDNAYNILRVADRRMVPDSVRVRQLVLSFNYADVDKTRALADSLARVLRAGGDFELLARRYSTDPNSAVNGGDAGWFTQDMLPSPIRDTLFLAKKNDVKMIPSRDGLIILQVSDWSKPLEQVMVGIVAKDVNPSQQTINRIYNEVRVFVDNMDTAEEFENAVAEKGETKRYATVSKNDHTIAGIEQGRDIIREAYMSGSTGKVLVNNRKSPIFECGDKYIVAVLTGIKEEGVSPLQEVTPSITRELIRRKKGDLIAKELQAAMSGSESLLSVAQKTGTEVQDAPDVSFASFQLPGAGIEPRVIAEVMRLEENRLSAPIVGNLGVFVTVVTNKTDATVSPEEIAQRKTSITQMRDYMVQYQARAALVQSAKVEDLRYKFY